MSQCFLFIWASIGSFHWEVEWVWGFQSKESIEPGVEMTTPPLPPPQTFRSVLTSSEKRSWCHFDGFDGRGSIKLPSNWLHRNWWKCRVWCENETFSNVFHWVFRSNRAVWPHQTVGRISQAAKFGTILKFRTSATSGDRVISWRSEPVTSFNRWRHRLNWRTFPLS